MENEVSQGGSFDEKKERKYQKSLRPRTFQRTKIKFLHIVGSPLGGHLGIALRERYDWEPFLPRIHSFLRL